MGFTINRSSTRQGEAKQPLVTIYFIGVNLMKGKDKQTPPTIFVGGHGAIRMPKIGGSLEVAANVARILEKQTTTWHPETGDPIPGVTMNKEYAETVRDAFESGKPLNQEIAERAVAHVPDDVLRAMFEKRFGPVAEPVYVDSKAKRSDSAVDGEIVYMDELPEGAAGSQVDNEVPVYQDESEETPAKKKAGRPAKGDS